MSEKIKNIHIKNIARLAEVDFDAPENGVIIVGGKNKAGKTTLIKSIWAGLGGKVPEIKDGKNKAEINLELDNYNVSLYLTNKSNKIKVEEKGNPSMVIKSPKTMLKDVLGKRCFDVTEFLSATPKNQLEILLKIVKIPGDKKEVEALGEGLIDLSKTENETHIFVNEAYEQILAEQRVNNRKEKALEIEIETGRKEYDLDIEEADLESLYNLKEKALQQESNKKALTEATTKISETKKQIKEYEEILAQKKLEVLQAEKQKKELASIIEELEPYELNEIENEITIAKENNAKFAIVKDIKQKTKELTEHTQNAAKLKSILTKIKQYKEDAMEETEFPIENLDIRASQIYYNDHPLAAASGAEQMLVATSIAASEMPKDGLQALFILDPPQLDSESWKFLEEYAVKKNIQIWIAKVEETQEKAHIYLIEGVQQ
uniref:Putative ATPase domain containing protein n=1 Tax=viral metagenome TaxID=1070528 RepID=A0A6H1ZLX0_9ZZZZ